MIVTQDNARAIIRSHYGAEFDFKLTTRCTIGMRPMYAVDLGFPTLAWRKLDVGRDSAVSIGRLMMGGIIDWTWEPQTEVQS